MKRILCAALAAFTSLAFGATLNPIQLLNPAGSTSGQAILSTGPSTAPAWGPVALSGITGTLAIANGGTGATTQAAALTNLLGASTVPLTNGGTGAATAAAARTNLGLGTAATQSTGTSGATVPLLSGANTWSGLQTYSAGLTVSGGAITPSQTAGIVGTTTNNNVNAGGIGEYVSATGTATALTTSTNLNVASISLTAGDWDVTGVAEFIPANTTVVAAQLAGVTTSSLTTPPSGQYARVGIPYTSTGQSSDVALPVVRFSLAATTTVYLVAASIFSTSTQTVSGTIRARRVR